MDEPRKSLRPVRAEYESVSNYLLDHLSDAERMHVLLPGFNQWDFALTALAETAISFRSLGSQVSVALWAEYTPLVDTGWTTSHKVAKLLHSAPLDKKYRRGLEAIGFTPKQFPPPPIERWRPVGQLPSPENFQRSAIRQLTYRESFVGRAILQVRPEPGTPTAEDHTWPRRWVTRSIRSYAWVFDQVSRLIEDRGITCLVTYNGRFLHDRAAVAAARAKGVKVLFYDQGGSDTAFDLTVNETHDWSSLQDRMKEMYQNWPAEERDLLGSEWFEDRISHRDPRNAHFTDGQRPGAFVDLPQGERTIVYFTSSSDEIAELEVDWNDYFGSHHQAVRILAEICHRHPGYRLVVRSHPHKRHKPIRDVNEWLQVVEEVKPDLHIDPHSSVDSYTLMRAADVVVTYGSTTGVEAAYFGKPSIVLGPSAYDELGCAVRPRSYEELEEALVAAESGSKIGAIQYGLMMKRRGFNREFIVKNSHGQDLLGNVVLDESAPRVRHLSHLIARLRRGYLTK